MNSIDAHYKIILTIYLPLLIFRLFTLVTHVDFLNI